MVVKRLGWVLLLVLPLLVASIGRSSAGLIPTQLNDDAVDSGKGDGTHDTQLDPDASFWGPKVGFAGFDRYSGSPQDVGTAYTVNGGSTWFDNGNIAGGSNQLQGHVSTAWNPKTEEYVVATENTFTGSGQRPIAVTRSDSWGVNWTTPSDTYTSIGFGTVARYPSLVINENEASQNYGYLYLLWTQDTGSITSRDLYYQWSPQGTSWSNPVKVNDANCPVVGRGQLTLAGDTIYAAYTCEEEDTYTPTVSSSITDGVSWNKVSTGLPVDLSYSGEDHTCGDGLLVKRTYYGGIGAFDFPRMTYDSMADMLFMTTTSHGDGTDLSDIRVFGAMETNNPTWVPYGGLPGDSGTTMFAPELAVSHIGGDRQLWYTGASVAPNATEYKVSTFVTIDLANWVVHPFQPSYPIPDLEPNEDTAVPDCYYGHTLFDLDVLGEKVGLTYVGVPEGSRRASGGTGVDPDILFALLDPPPKETAMTLTIKKTDTKIKASGKITPPVPGGEAEVTLLKKKDGTFQAVGNPKVAAFDANGAYKTSFKRPSKGKCRVTGDWNGDGNFAASGVTKTFDCKA